MGIAHFYFTSVPEDAYSADPGEIMHSVAFHTDLQCLQMYLFGGSSIQRVIFCLI